MKSAPSSESSTAVAGRGADRLVILGLATILMVGHAWMIGLHFGLDDFDYIVDAALPVSMDRYLMGGPPPGNDGDRLDAYVYLVRPVMYGSLVLDRLLFGTRPAGYHAVNVIVHGLTAFLTAFLAAMLFAENARDKRAVVFSVGAIMLVHPGKLAAVAWVEARCDLFVGLFLVLGAWALLLAPRIGALKSAVLAAISALAAVGSKESGFAVPFALVLFDVLRPVEADFESRRRRVTRVSIVQSVVVAAAISARVARLGELSSFYHGDFHRMSMGVIGRMLTFVPATVVRHSSGYFYGDGAGGAVEIAAVVATAAILLAAGSAAPRRTIRVLAAFVAMLGVVVGPTMRFLHESSNFSPSRLFYAATTVVAMLLGIALTRAFAAGGWRRFVAGVAAIALAVIWTRATVEDAHRFRGAAEITTRVLEATQRIFSENGDVVIVAADVPDQHGRTPSVGSFLPRAFERPFRDPPFDVVTPASFETFFLFDRRRLSVKPLMLVRFDPENGDLVDVRGPLAPPEPLPSPRALTGSAIDLVVDVAVRGLGMIVFDFADPMAKPPLEVRLKFDDGSEKALTWSAEPEFTSGGRRMVPIAWSGAILEHSRIVCVAARTYGAAFMRVRFLKERESIAWCDGGLPAIALGAAPPIFEFRTDRDYPLYRIVVRSDQTVASWYFASDTLELLKDGTKRRELDLARTVPGLTQAPTWEWMAREGLAALDRDGLESKTVDAVLAAYDGDPRIPVAMSPPLRVRLVR